MLPLTAVRVHCGSAYVRGRARRYSYFVAQLFRAAVRRRDGALTYRATGIVAGPFRSRAKTERAGRELARANRCPFVEGYGSLHGAVAIPPPESAIIAIAQTL